MLTNNPKKIVLLTDSSSGLTNDDFKKYNIEILPLHIIYEDGTDFLDTEENAIKYNLYDEITKAETKTSQASPGELETKYDVLLEQYDQVIHYPIAKKLSSQYATAVMVSREAKYKDKVFVVENNTAAFALKDTLIYAQSLIEKGFDVTKIIEKTTVYENQTLMTMIPGNLARLNKGGRVKSFITTVMNFLKIKVLILWGAEPKKYGLSRTIGKLLNDLFKLIDSWKTKFRKSYEIFVLKSERCSEKIWTMITEKFESENVTFKVEKLANIFLTHAGLDTVAFVALPSEKDDVL